MRHIICLSQNNSVKISLVQEGEIKKIMLHTVLVYKTCAYKTRAQLNNFMLVYFPFAYDAIVLCFVLIKKSTGIYLPSSSTCCFASQTVYGITALANRRPSPIAASVLFKNPKRSKLDNLILLNEPFAGNRCFTRSLNRLLRWRNVRYPLDAENLMRILIRQRQSTLA